MRNMTNRIICGLMLILAGCATPPSTSIHQPMTARAPENRSMADNGGIFQPGLNDRPLYDGRRARYVGDTLTILIQETNSAMGKSNNSAEHKGSMEVETPSITKIPGTNLKMAGIGIASSSNGNLGNKSNNAGDNTFTGTITVTVTEVLANGNLLVSGEKQVAINQANEYIRFSGVVNPYYIIGVNTVKSTQVADAHIEYKGANQIDMSVVMSMLGRAFMSILPF